MVHDIFHFRPGQLVEDLELSSDHRVLGKLVRLLTSFQLDAIRFLYKNFESNRACILNDESGLGKTAVVAAFLSAIIPADNSKRCLVIVKDSQRVVSWRFHLEVLTKLHVKLLVDDSVVDNNGNVFLVAWETLRKSPNLAKTVFNCVVLDDRGELTTFKACLNFFLRHFENRISLIVASTDVTLDIKALHGLLRLCGRLDDKYQKLKVFDEKFSFPKAESGQTKDKLMLEAYFQRREKIINYCRDFRLRRYRHQFEDVLPLVSSSTFERSVQEWREREFSKSASISSGSLKILSSSSEKNTEELFQTYFDSRTDKLLNDEVRSFTENASHADQVKDRLPHDTEDMSPLLFESDSEDFSPPEPLKCSVDNSSGIGICCPKASKDLEPEKNLGMEGNSTHEELEMSPPSGTTQKGCKKRNKKQDTIDLCSRSLRSAVRKTRRIKTCPSSRNAIIDVFRMVEKAEDILKMKKRKLRKRNSIHPPSRQQDEEIVLNVSSESENEADGQDELEGQPSADASNAEITVEKNVSPASNYSFNIDLVSKPLAPDSSEVQICSQSDQIIILSSSSDGSDLAIMKLNKSAPRKVIDSGKISPSPDIFENCDEYDFMCSQKGKSVTPNNKNLPQKRRKISGKRVVSSCLQQLEEEFRAKNKPDSNGRPELKELGFTDIFTSMVQIHSSNFRLSGQNNSRGNKITRYLSSQSLELSQPNRLDATAMTAKEIDCYPKTPQRQMSTVSQKMSPSLAKKSPKSQRQTPLTPNGLTKWLIKKTPDGASQEEKASKSARRKRLDLWFKD